MTDKKKIFFFYKEEKETLLAKKLSRQMNLPFCGIWKRDLFKDSNFEDHYGFIYSTLGSYVLPIVKTKTNPIICRFSLTLNETKSTNLMKTMKGVSKRSKILDATGGFGRDAFEIASHYNEVRIAEKVPWVHYLLNECILKFPKKSDFYPKLRLDLIDSVKLLSKEFFDVIYLDPMFGPELKKSESKKEIQLLKDCLPNEDPSNLFSLAIKSAKNRVIVKRHPRLDYMLGEKPNFSITSKLVRYDVYKN